MEQDDGQLVKQTLAGDDEAFETIVSNYLAGVHRFVYRLVGDSETASDITQETFLKVWKNLSKFRIGESLRAWIFTIARNTATDYLRKKKAVTFSKLSNEDFDYEDSLESEDDLPDEIIAKIFEKQVSVNVHFVPVPMMTFYKNLGYDISNYPESFNHYKNVITLPVYFDLDDEKVATVIDAVVRSVEEVV